MKRKQFQIPPRKVRKQLTVEEIYLLYKKPILKQLSSDKTLVFQDCEDILHDAFVDLIRRYDTIIWDMFEQGLSWIVSKSYLKHYNKFIRPTFVQTNDDSIVEGIVDGSFRDPLAEMVRVSNRDMFVDAMARFSKSESEVFMRYYFGGESCEKIAGTKWSVNTVFVLLSRSRNKVLAHFTGESWE